MSDKPQLQTRQVRVGRAVFGSGQFQVIAGPCSIESSATLDESCEELRALNIPLLRGGVFKMRTSPNAFQGLGSEIFSDLDRARKQYGLGVVVELTDVRHLDAYREHVDLIQVGSRNMYNYPMLVELGKINLPILLKRAFSATFDEWIGAAQYIERGGNRNVILCERGIRTFEPRLRNTLDLGMVALLKAETDYPVVVDPSHASGRRDLVAPLARAAKAVGADGLLVEYHPHPEKALSDREQTIDGSELRALIASLGL